MALTYGFFDAELVQGQYDRVYDAAEFAQYFSLLIKNGVFPDPSTNLQVKASSPTANMNVNIEAGYGWINGYWAKNDSPYTLTIQPAHGSLNRIDAVVLRWVSSTRSMEFDVLTGTPNASPQIPNLTRTVEIYELMLASITVANGATSIAQASITDKRPDSSVCGWVTSLIENIDTTDLFAQFEDAFDTWFDNIKGQLEGDVVTNLQRQIDERVKIEDKATEEEAIAGTNDTKWMTPKTADVAIKQKANKIGDIVTASYDKEIDSNGNFVKCDGRALLDSAYPEFGNITNKIYGNPIELYSVSGIESEYTKYARANEVNGGYTSENIYKVHIEGTYVHLLKINIELLKENSKHGVVVDYNINLNGNYSTNACTPLFFNDDETLICFTTTAQNGSIYTLRFDINNSRLSIINEISIQNSNIGYITGTIKTSKGYRTVIFSKSSGLQYATVLDVDIDSGAVAQLITYNGDTIYHVVDTCYCLYNNILYIQGNKKSNTPCVYTVDPSAYNSITTHDYNDESIPLPVKNFLFNKNTKQFTHLLSYSETVSYGAYISNNFIQNIYKIDNTKEDDEAFTTLEYIDMATLTPMNIISLSIFSIDFIQLNDNSAWGIMLYYDRSVGQKSYYFEIKGNTMYIYDTDVSGPGNGALYGYANSVCKVKGSYKRTDISYSNISDQGNGSGYYYGTLKEKKTDMFNVPNLRVIDYIKVK